MRPLDRVLQMWRIRMGMPWVRTGDRLLDVGCFDLSLLERVEERVQSAVGVDIQARAREGRKIEVMRGHFPEDFAFGAGTFDCVTSLAVLEHVEDPRRFAEACFRVLVPGGRVVITVPHPFVDRIIDALLFLGLIDGMATAEHAGFIEEHHGYRVEETVPIFVQAGFRVVVSRSFQLGLNRLFVFEKPESPPEVPASARV